MRGRRKQGYFFLIDAIIASVVLFAGLFVLFSTGITTQEKLQPLVTLEDLVTVISITPISSTVNDYYVDELLPQGIVPYPDATPLEEIVYLLYANCPTTNCTSHAENYTLSLFAATLDPQYGAQLSVNNTIVAQYGSMTPRYVYARSVVVYARNETGIIGPLIGEVQLWG